MGVDAAYASRSRFAALQSLREAAGLVAKFGVTLNSDGLLSNHLTEI